MVDRISETAFAHNVEEALYTFRWRFMHPRPARVRRHGREIYETAYSGHKGFLDYIALRAPRVLVFELKDAYSKMTPEQEEWFAEWKECVRMITFVGIVKGQIPVGETELCLHPSIEVYLWRPRDFDKILEVLK